MSRWPWSEDDLAAPATGWPRAKGYNLSATEEEKTVTTTPYCQKLFNYQVLLTLCCTYTVCWESSLQQEEDEAAQGAESETDRLQLQLCNSAACRGATGGGNAWVDLQLEHTEE